MKKFIILFVLLVSGCAQNKSVLVRNCKTVGTNLYSCEEIPQKDVVRLPK